MPLSDTLQTRVKPDAQILVVEDDPNSAGFFRTLMAASQGYKAHLCYSGEKALQVLASGKDFDAVGLDPAWPERLGGANPYQV